MSLIADALRKAAERPRKSAVPPKIKTVSLYPKRKTRRWIYGGLALAAIVGGVSLSGQPARRQPASILVPSEETRAAPAAGQDAAAPQDDTGLALLRVAESHWRINGKIDGGDGRPLVLVNGKIVQEGETLNGVKITRIAENSVDLEAGGHTTTLQIEE